MRVGTLNISGRPTVVVVSQDGQQYRAASDLIPGFDGDMADFIARMPTVPAGAAQSGSWNAVEGNKVLAPIPVPRRNIFCIGKNYHEHAKEFGQSGFDTSAAKGEVAPPAPVVFTKATSSVVADQDTRAIVLAPDAATRLRGGTGSSDRQARARHQQGRCAQARVGLYHRQRRHRARPAAAASPMVPGQIAGHLLPDGPVDRHRRRGR